MALPQTPRAIEDAVRAMRDILPGQMLGIFDRSPLFAELFQPRRVYLQRPYTDDMMQMCADLGIDVPIFQPISYDGRSFRFQPTAAVMVDAEGFTPISYSQMYMTIEEDYDGQS